MDLPLGILDYVAFAATFTQAAATTVDPTVAPTVSSIELNTGNLLVKLVLWHIGNSGCEVISRLRIYNAVKVSPEFNILECVGEFRVLDTPEWFTYLCAVGHRFPLIAEYFEHFMHPI